MGGSARMRYRERLSCGVSRSAALDGAYLALELDGALDVAQHDGACSGARHLDGAVVEQTAPEALLDQDALHLADDNLVRMTVNPSMAVKESLVAHKDGCRHVANQATQMQVGNLAQSGLVKNGFARCYNFADFHNIS